MSPAPIALFAYKRPQHLRRTVEALRQNVLARESELYLFSDAPANAAAAADVAAVRAYARGITGFGAVTLVEREANLGLARSVIAGVGQLCASHGRVVVIEDDLVTSPHFLRFMNDGLDLYADDERVASIHGYQYPVAGSLPETFFLRGTDCWGWATWRRAWDLFEPDGRALLRELEARKLTREFDFDGSYPYTRMLKAQIDGRNDSWAIRWYASAFLREKFTLYPGRSLVLNIGLDDSGTHCSANDAFAGELAADAVAVRPIAVVEDAAARRQVAAFQRASRALTPARIGNKLASMLKRWGRP